eukprot:13397537-Ditylum_brightwellii.AAC.1
MKDFSSWKHSSLRTSTWNSIPSTDDSSIAKISHFSQHCLIAIYLPDLTQWNLYPSQHIWFIITK